MMQLENFAIWVCGWGEGGGLRVRKVNYWSCHLRHSTSVKSVSASWHVRVPRHVHLQSNNYTRCYTSTSPALFFCHTVNETRYFLLNYYKPSSSVYTLVGSLATPYFQIDFIQNGYPLEVDTHSGCKNFPVFHEIRRVVRFIIAQS